jgi:integrase/recombinase XerD
LIRVPEAANSRRGDLRTGYGQCEIFIRHGKGAKSRTIPIPASLKTHLKQYIAWKRDRGAGTGDDDHLFLGRQGPTDGQRIQQLVKKRLKALGLQESGKSVYALRHSYAVQLYRQQWDLRAVQKQLGHSSISTTTIYADILKEDIAEQVEGLWR